MMHAFETLGKDGVGDPQRLSANIGEVLIPTAIGFGVSLAGLALICIALFRYRYRAKWFFWYLTISSCILLFGFPVGTIIGVIILSFCLARKHEFLTPGTSGEGQGTP
jgi:hypothetical protein